MHWVEPARLNHRRIVFVEVVMISTGQNREDMIQRQAVFSQASHV